MNLYLKPKELEKRCKHPTFCKVCHSIRKDVKVDEHNVCENCRKGSNGMPRRLPTVTLDDGKTYFIDERLKQLRNVNNPHDFIDF